MKEFVDKYQDRIHGVLSCFDRMIFRGYLPIMSGWAMAAFLYRLNQNRSSLRPFLLQNSQRVKNHAIAMAKQHGRPFQYLTSNIDKDKAAQQLAQRDGIQHGLVCIYSIRNPVALFRLCSTSRFPINGRSCDPHEESVYTSISTLWTAISA